MENPYKVLGVSQRATDSEIKKAYRELAKKYHPDNYIDSPLADIASEKMKRINEAYATIVKERENGGNKGENVRVVHSETEIRARYLITEGRISEAEVILNRVSKSEQTAEWHYLMGVLYARRGMLWEAKTHAETAYKMEKNNEEYLALLENISETSKTMKSNGSEGNICGSFGCGKFCKF